MKRGFIAAIAVVLAGACGTTYGEPPLTSRFSVDFTGIVQHLAWNVGGTSYQRAVVIQSNLFAPHYPRIYVALPDCEAAQQKLSDSLNKATGKKASCDQNHCGVEIDGIVMRIRGDGNTPPTPPPLVVDASFTCLLPRLRQDPEIGATYLRPAVVAVGTEASPALPRNGAVGFFEIENGRLDAYPFQHAGYFTRTPPIIPAQIERECVKRCRQFADVVTWSGLTNGPAVLEIFSDDTKKWTPIEASNQGPLMISVENLGNHASPTHFALNSKSFVNATLPVIVECHSCQNKCPAGAGIGALNLVPGCSDTQWP